MARESQMVYQFKHGTHVPDGVTPEGVMDEREDIERRSGAATIDASVDAVLKTPKRYPNLRAFGPVDADDAMRRAMAEGIRLAYRSVVRVKVMEYGAPVSRPVRVIHAVPNADHGANSPLEFKTMEQIKKDPRDTKALIKQLEADARAFAGKMQDVLAEIQEALLWHLARWRTADRPYRSGHGRQG